jgi:hypothetical protein
VKSEVVSSLSLIVREKRLSLGVQCVAKNGSRAQALLLKFHAVGILD